MKIYKVEYCGLWMGGIAIVQANTPKEALELVELDERTLGFDSDATAVEVTGPVFYNDNGDY